MQPRKMNQPKTIISKIKNFQENESKLFNTNSSWKQKPIKDAFAYAEEVKKKLYEKNPSDPSIGTSMHPKSIHSTILN